MKHRESQLYKERKILHMKKECKETKNEPKEHRMCNKVTHMCSYYKLCVSLSIEIVIQTEFLLNDTRRKIFEANCFSIRCLRPLAHGWRPMVDGHSR